MCLAWRMRACPPSTAKLLLCILVLHAVGQASATRDLLILEHKGPRSAQTIRDEIRELVDTVPQASSARGGAPSPFSASSPDPSVISWNKTFVGPNNIACAMMTVPLDHDRPGPGFPTTQVHVCIKFASVQPAPKGLLFCHAGGPSTGTLGGLLGVCGSNNPLYDDLGALYDRVAIDQRGLDLTDARNNPVPTSMRSYVPGKIFPVYTDRPYGMKGDYPPTFSGVNNCSRDYTDLPGFGTTDACPFGDVCKWDELSARDRVALIARASANRWRRCVNDPKYKLTGPNGIELNFYDHSGTYELARDMETLRLALGAPNISLYGVSYGTAVAGAYASAFPGAVDKLVLDSTVNPISSVLEHAESFGMGWEQATNFLLASCSEAPDCPIKGDVPKVINELTKRLVDGEVSFTDVNDGRIKVLDPFHLWARMDPGKPATVYGFLQDAAALIAGDANVAAELWKDTPETFLDYWAATGNNIAAAVNSQDLAGRYSPEFLGEQFTSYMTQFPSWIGAYRAALTLVASAVAPQPHPLPVMGHPGLKGVVYGALYDARTPYRNAQRMHDVFPSTSMVTGQYADHGIQIDGVYVNQARNPVGEACYQVVVKRYLVHGILPPNGLTCGDEDVLPPVTPSLQKALEVKAAEVSAAVGPKEEEKMVDETPPVH